MKFKIFGSLFILFVLIVVAMLARSSGNPPSGEDGITVPVESQ